jgi:cbb3-type cytochrome oxidase maturation protein
MDWMLILVPLSLAVALGIGLAFAWAARSGQFEDLDSHGRRVLADDDASPARDHPDRPPNP